jgi:DNA-binding CsgD family transcriptional regulator
VNGTVRPRPISSAHWPRTPTPGGCLTGPRTHLALGEHLRRRRRRVDAREHVRTALALFEELGAASWAERAAQELRACGETARRRDVTTATDLTPQERQVAGLFRQGLSNRDAAAQPFVSPRIVDFHLRNVFSKLGVASRAELTALPWTCDPRSGEEPGDFPGVTPAGGDQEALTASP